MYTKQNLLLLLTLVSLGSGSAFLQGCGSSHANAKTGSAVAENPNDAITQFEARLNEARQADLQVLSPENFKKAEAALAEAKDARKGGASLDKIEAELKRGQQNLEKAHETAKLAETVMPDVIAARQAALSAGAGQLKDFKDAEEKLLDLTYALERNDIDVAKNRGKAVAERYSLLEVEGVQKVALEDARKIVQQAKDERANKLVPKTFGETNDFLKKVEVYIRDNPKQTAEIQKMGTDALFQANRLLNLTRQAWANQKVAPEQLALNDEAFFHRLTQEIGGTDLRNQTFDAQADYIASGISDLKRDRDFILSQNRELESKMTAANSEMNRLQGAGRKEQDKLAKLEAERRTQVLYEQVKQMFKVEEADISRDGNQIKVSLKGLQFPVGKNIINPEHFRLLAKAQQAIRSFGEPVITIVGNTDSTGSKVLNQQLAQERAEAVKSYLLANNTLPESKISTQALGFDKPIAANRTKEGRAMNRRVDIIIDATTATAALTPITTSPRRSGSATVPSTTRSRPGSSESSGASRVNPGSAPESLEPETLPETANPETSQP